MNVVAGGRCTSIIEANWASEYPGDRFDVVLMKLLRRQQGSEYDWTEYTLYWSCGCKARMNQQFHTSHPTLKLYDYWGFRHGARINHQSLDGKHVFGVLQSISGASGSKVSLELKEHILGP